MNDDAVGRLATVGAIDGFVAHVGGDSVPLTNADLSNLARLTKCPSFDFDNTPLTDAQLALFAGRRISFLTVAGTKLSDRAMTTVATLLELTNLCLQRTVITDAGLEHLRDHPALTKLTAQLDGVTPASAPVLASLRLEDVALSGMNNEAMCAIAKPTLHTCMFSDSEIGAAGLAALAEKTQIETLWLGRSRIEPGALAALTAANGLLNLMLRRTNVGNKDAADIARIPSLGGLDLAQTQITDEGVRELAACGSLQGLDLSGTSVTDAGIEALADLPLLTKLNVDDTAVTRAALDRLPHVPKPFDLAD